jgi:GT2 family glycosyltransferase
MGIIAVVVLYNSTVEESYTIKSLMLNHPEYLDPIKDFHLIIYDNGLVEQEIKMNIPFKFQYFHNPKNEGLAVAYNYALKEAIHGSYSWMLLLDQDSSLPEVFLSNLFDDLNKIADDCRITAVVPRMYYKDNIFSPSKVLFGGLHRPINKNHKGIYKHSICAIGSCSLIKIEFLEMIGGFNEFFWMDSLDRWLFLTIEKNKGIVYVSNSLIEHELSILDYDKFVSENRYNNIMKYETFFMKLYKSKSENFIYYLRLLNRILIFSLSEKNKMYAKLTWCHLKEILFTSRFADIHKTSGFNQT